MGTFGLRRAIIGSFLVPPCRVDDINCTNRETSLRDGNVPDHPEVHVTLVQRYNFWSRDEVRLFRPKAHIRLHRSFAWIE